MITKTGPLRAADVRRRNKNLVLRLIYTARGEGLSQSEAVAATGLKAPTVFRIFSSLEGAGYIEPLAAGGSPVDGKGRQERKGRRPLAYVAKSDALYAIGVEFWGGQVSLGVFDFQGLSIFTKTLLLSGSESAAKVVGHIVSLVREAVSALAIPREKVLGIGVGAPGQVNVGRRIVISYPRIAGMKDFPIAAMLEKELGFSVFLHNNCSVIALSEFRYGKLQVGDSMLMVLLRSGVNGAFVEGGKIFLSPGGTTIEMGHISIDFDGPACACGAKGCLEAYISGLDRESQNPGLWLFENLEGRGDSDSAVLDAAASYLASAAQTASRLFKPSSFLFIAHSGDVASGLALRVEERFFRDPAIFNETAPRFFGCPYDPELARRGAADLVVDAFLG